MAHTVEIKGSEDITITFQCRLDAEDKLVVSKSGCCGFRFESLGGGVILLDREDEEVLVSFLAGTLTGTLTGTLHEAKVRAIGFGDTVYAGGEPRLVAQSPGGGVSLIDPRDGTLCGGTTSLQSLHDDMLHGCKVYELGDEG